MSTTPERQPESGSVGDMFRRGLPILRDRVFGLRRGRNLVTQRQLDAAIETARQIPQTTRSHDQPDSVEQSELDTTAEQMVTDLQFHLGPHTSQEGLVSRRSALRTLLVGGAGAAVGEGLRRTFSSEDPALAEFRNRVGKLEGDLADALRRATGAEAALAELRDSSAREIAMRDGIISGLRTELAGSKAETENERKLRIAEEAKNKALADRITELEKPLADMRRFEADHNMPTEFGSKTPSTAKLGWRIRAAKPAERFIDQPGRETQTFRTKNKITFPSGGLIDGILRPRGIDVLSEDTGMTVHSRRNSEGGISVRIDLVTKLDDKGEPSEIVTFTLPPDNKTGTVVFEKVEGGKTRREVLRFVNPQTEGGYFTAKYQSESTR